VVRVQPRHIDAELVHVRFAYEQSARGAQPRDDGRIGGGAGGSHETGARGGRVSRLIQFIFHRHRHAIERAELRTGTPARARRLCLRDDIIAIDRDECAQPRRVAPASLALRDEAFRDPLRRRASLAVRAREIIDARKMKSRRRSARICPRERRNRARLAGELRKERRRIVHDFGLNPRKPGVPFQLVHEKRTGERIFEQ
jgi:hypothetical protein